MKRIRKPKSLEQQLLDVKKGETVEIHFEDYAYSGVRSVVAALNSRGYQFSTTVVGIRGKVEVTRHE